MNPGILGSILPLIPQGSLPSPPQLLFSVAVTQGDSEQYGALSLYSCGPLETTFDRPGTPPDIPSSATWEET